MIYFLTFGAPSKQYHHCVERLCNEAINLCCFDKITGMNEINLQKDAIFWNQHGNFINDHKKGFGYWIWKSYIIMKHLQEEMKEDGNKVEMYILYFLFIKKWITEMYHLLY